MLGGDLTYPAVTAHDYHNRFVGPFSAALPACDERSRSPRMFSVAGNHDWYDGLTTFLRMLCTGRAIGGWQTEQTRSYFVVRLPHGWWMLGIDLAVDFFIDEPQMAFFRRAATELLSPGGKVILVTHHPSWLFDSTGEERTHSPLAMSNLGRVPKHWRLLHDPPGRPTFEPIDRPLAPHLIEAPSTSARIQSRPDLPAAESASYAKRRASSAA